MLRSNRCGSGPVYGDADQAQFGLLPAGSLNPQKARVLLILALIAGLDQPGLASLCEAA
jgi:L-asparaginase